VGGNFSIIDGITLSIAILGAVLGVLNTWRAIDRDRVKLKVIPKKATPVGNTPDKRIRLCIDVTNLSTFPLTITEVGLRYYGTDKRGAVVNPIIIDGGAFPRRLEPRTTFTAYLHPDALKRSDGHLIKCAYAKTDCGEFVKDSSPALKQMASQSLVEQEPIESN
jgi:hypothetical protein